MDAFSMIGEFSTLCEAAATPETVAEGLFETARRAGFAHTSYLCGDAPGEPGTGLLFTDYPDDWRQHYGAHGYREIDPILAHAHRALEPFQWSEALVRAAMTPRQIAMLEDAKDFGVGFGYAVPLHASLTVNAACFFASPHDDIAPLARAAMRRASVVAHEHFCRLARQAAAPAAAPALSPRERTALTLFARGLGDADISRALAIELPTVRGTLDRARRRLGVATRQEALVAALVSRQIAPSAIALPRRTQQVR